MGGHETAIWLSGKQNLKIKASRCTEHLEAQQPASREGLLEEVTSVERGLE